MRKRKYVNAIYRGAEDSGGNKIRVKKCKQGNQITGAMVTPLERQTSSLVSMEFAGDDNEGIEEIGSDFGSPKRESAPRRMERPDESSDFGNDVDESSPLAPHHSSAGGRTPLKMK